MITKQIIQTYTPSGQPVYLELPIPFLLTNKDRDWIIQLVTVVISDKGKEAKDE